MPIKQLIALSVIFLPRVAWGQAQTPAEAADVALRARVTEFLQYHVEGNFRKAYDMVAEDTKEDYFNSGKAQLQSFKIDDIKFTDNFTKAAVTATISKTMAVVGQEFLMAMPSATTWKIENGKWVWYNETKAVASNPVAPLSTPGMAAAAPQGANTGNVTLPKEFDPKAIAAAAQNILQQVRVDKREVTLATNRASEDRVVFHNGMPGSVQLELNAPDVPGFTAKIEEANVRGGGDAPVVLRYDGAGHTDPITVQLVVQPLNQAFPIRVNFTAAGPAKSK